MDKRTRPQTLLLAWGILFLAVGPAGAGAPAFSAEPGFAGLPIPNQTALVASAAAEGVQIYEAKRAENGGYRWELKGPRATLTTVTGEAFGTHDFGPTWTANDGSQVAGALVTKVSAPVPGAIPWVLLSVKAKTGAGILADVRFVLRVGTSGGAAPAEAPAREGETRQVAYRALYLFLR